MIEKLNDVIYWKKGEKVQNFGDYLTEYFMRYLFNYEYSSERILRIVGSFMEDNIIKDDIISINRLNSLDEACYIAWGGGLRSPNSLSQEVAKKINILSVRGPLSALELGLDQSYAKGDPGLILPALYKAKLNNTYHKKTVCIPHFNDERLDQELLRITNCDLILRPNIPLGLEEIEIFIDKLSSADFILTGSLHGAIIAAAYKIPFAYFNSLNIDIPFKWYDFSESVNIATRFVFNIEAAKAFYYNQIKPNIVLPRLAPMLCKTPYPVKNSAWINILNYDKS